MSLSCLSAQQDSIVTTEPTAQVDTIPQPMDTIPLPKTGKQKKPQGPDGFDSESMMDSMNNVLNNERGSRGAAFETLAPASVSLQEGGVEYGSKDSSTTDIINQLIHLYGEAYVRYDEFEIKSDYIVFNLNTNEVEALSRPHQLEKPTFINGEQTVAADHIRYNMDSEKGIVHGARIKQGEFYIHGATTKFVRAGSDSLHIDDVVYNKNALLTTCDQDHPHWGIRTTKLKMIPEKLAVVGPFDMELGGIPTPLAMPFAFAPLFNFAQGTSGIIFPERDPIIVDPILGIGTRGLGYYFALSDRMDLKLTGDIYTRGTFLINAESNYKKRYKYSGRVALQYSNERQDVAGSLLPNKELAYKITINHRQDAKAHPYRTIGGSLNFTINDFDRRNFSDAQAQLNSQINSNFSFAQKINSKTNFTTSIQHSQNTRNRSINFTLPEMQLRVSRFFPFKKKGSSASNEQWYEKINMQYNTRFQNRVSTVDTLLFTSQTLDEFRYGLSQDVDINASYKLLQYFAFNTSVNYDEFNYFQTYEHTGVDSTGSIVGGIVDGLETLREIDVSANISTNLFSTIQFAKGKLRGIRHQMTPTVGLAYSPSTQNRELSLVDTISGFTSEQLRYNPFSAENGESLIFNNRLQQGGARITFGLANTFEGKLWSKRDSMEKKFKIFNSVNLNGSYNLQADSLNWSLITLSANARVFGGKTTLSISGSWDPYLENENGTRINKTTLSEGKLFRWEAFTAGLATNITFKDIRDFFKGGVKEDNNQGGSSTQRGASRGTSRRGSKGKPGQLEEDELFSWFEGARISHTYRIGITSTNIDGERIEGVETIAHSIQLTTGNIPLSDKWGMSVGNLSYDLKRGRWVFPSFSLTRDLHCWQMAISWQPQLDTYSFSIGVKASPFSNYIKYATGRNNFQGVNSFR